MQGRAGGGDEIVQIVGKAELDLVLIHDLARPGTGICREHEALAVHPEHTDGHMLRALRAGHRAGKGSAILLIEGVAPGFRRCLFQHEARRAIGVRRADPGRRGGDGSPAAQDVERRRRAFVDGADGPDIDRNVVGDAELEPVAHDLARGAPSFRRHHEARPIGTDDADDLGRLAARAHVVAGEGGAVLAFDDQLPGQMKVVAEDRGGRSRIALARPDPGTGMFDRDPGTDEIGRVGRKGRDRKERQESGQYKRTHVRSPHFERLKRIRCYH